VREGLNNMHVIVLVILSIASVMPPAMVTGAPPSEARSRMLSAGTNRIVASGEPLVQPDKPPSTDCRQWNVGAWDHGFWLSDEFPSLQPGTYTLQITLTPRGQSQSDSDRLTFTVP